MEGNKSALWLTVYIDCRLLQCKVLGVCPLGQPEHSSMCLHTAMHTAWLLWLLLPLETNSSTMVCKHPFAGADLGIPVQDLLFCIIWDVQFWLYGGVVADSPLPLPSNEIMLFTDIFPEVWEAEALTWARALLFKFFSNFSSTLKKKKKVPGPTLLSDAIFTIFIPPDQCLPGQQFSACN